MLMLRTDQMETFHRTALHEFEDEMVVHSKEFSPRLCQVIDHEQTRLAVRSAMKHAMAYGFTCRGPIRLYIEMMFLCGSAFDTDPQYRRVGEVLGSSDGEMQRAEKIHQGQLDYLRKVSGPGAANVHNALKNLLAFAQMPISFSSSNLVAGTLQEMLTCFPEKVAYIGEEALTQLIEEARAEATEYHFPSPRGEVMIAVLMFAFGHGCTNDPLYPWISRTLLDNRIVDPAARAARLQKKALTWLEHVIAENQRGERP